MDIKSIRNFLALARNLNFTETAHHNYMSQSALSKQIRQMEKELNTQLFIRDKRNVVLTPTGNYLKEEFAKIINQYDYIVNRGRQLASGEAGEIKIGYTHSAMQSMLPSLIYKLNQTYPNLKTTLKEMTNTHQGQALMTREIDISISPNPIVEPGVRSKVMITGPFAIVLPMHHKLNRRNLKSLSQLANEPFILPSRSEGTLYVGIIESIFTDAGFYPHIIHETSYANTGIRLVQAGIGVTVEPAYGLAGYNHIKIIELKDITQKAELTMLWLPEFEQAFPYILSLLLAFDYG